MAAALLYYVTDRSAFSGDEFARRKKLLEKIEEAAQCGVDYIQLREKDLPSRQLESLAREAAEIVQRVPAGNRQQKTALLINSRVDIALAVAADGVHLRGDDISPEDVRSGWLRSWGAGTPARELSPRAPVVSVSCHATEEVANAAAQHATLAIFAPVFEKKDAPEVVATGLEALRRACREKIPVIALGGVTMENARACLEAGAAGIAGIRLFQENDIAGIVQLLSS